MSILSTKRVSHEDYSIVNAIKKSKRKHGVDNWRLMGLWIVRDFAALLRLTLLSWLKKEKTELKIKPYKEVLFLNFKSEMSKVVK